MNWKTCGQFPKKLNIYLLYDPAVLILGIYTREIKAYLHAKNPVHEFSKQLSEIALKWNKVLRANDINCSQNKKAIKLIYIKYQKMQINL